VAFGGRLTASTCVGNRNRLRSVGSEAELGIEAVAHVEADDDANVVEPAVRAAFGWMLPGEVEVSATAERPGAVTWVSGERGSRPGAG
jgi:hypothetical protein